MATPLSNPDRLTDRVIKKGNSLDLTEE